MLPVGVVGIVLAMRAGCFFFVASLGLVLACARRSDDHGITDEMPSERGDGGSQDGAHRLHAGCACTSTMSERGLRRWSRYLAVVT